VLRRVAAGLWLVLLGASSAAANELIGVIAAAKPAVVAIGTLNAVDNPRFTFRGSGFAIGDGTLVATGAHVVPGANEIEALDRLSVLIPGDGRTSHTRRARVVALEPAHDLALLKIDGPALPALPLADNDNAQQGQSVLLLGFPIGGALGFSTVAHLGIVAAITPAALPAPSSRHLDPRGIAHIRRADFEILQLDVTAYPGNSGGPLLDAASGAVVGVMSMALIKGGRESALSAPTGISYAIPVRHLREMLTRATVPR
jgi:S1-C subfamily serine protease